MRVGNNNKSLCGLGPRSQGDNRGITVGDKNNNLGLGRQNRIKDNQHTNPDKEKNSNNQNNENDRNPMPNENHQNDEDSKTIEKHPQSYVSFIYYLIILCFVYF